MDVEYTTSVESIPGIVQPSLDITRTPSMLSFLLHSQSPTGSVSTENKQLFKSSEKKYSFMHSSFCHSSELQGFKFLPDQPATLGKNFSCEDLIRSIYQEFHFNNTININDLALLVAEEDGTPMDDLPGISKSTDIFQVGVSDFALMRRINISHSEQVDLYMVHCFSYSLSIGDAYTFKGYCIIIRDQ